MIRQPIITFLGHVDSGKTSIQDFIRGTNITEKEAGGITQKISTTHISLAKIKQICGTLLAQSHLSLTIPGILMIDSPGHAAFTNLRKRGGNIADIAILVVDIKEGIMPQTKESIEILKSYKTPFVIALNKIDTVSSFRSRHSLPLVNNLKTQSEKTLHEIETKLYDIVKHFSEFGLNAERFDRIDDYKKQIAIVPCSAKKGDGIPELLAIVAGLAQKYLENSLRIAVNGTAKGIILEVKEMRGVGVVLDVIIYDGKIKQNDKIAIATLHEPIITKVRGIFEYSPGKMIAQKEVSAAAAVLLAAPHLGDALAGMPFQSFIEGENTVKKELKQQVQEVVIENDHDGIILKADTLGSLEALTNLVKEKKIPIKKASLGEISKRDIADAKAEKELPHRAILGFNVKSTQSDGVVIITNEVIYKILDDYGTWLGEAQQKEEQKELKNVTYPVELRILRGCVFRQSHPAIVGVLIIAGKLINGASLMKADGSRAGDVKSMQFEGENISEAQKNKEVAIALPGITVGRQINEDDILYTNISEGDFDKLKKLKKFLKHEDIELLKKIVLIKRKSNPLWGI